MIVIISYTWLFGWWVYWPTPLYCSSGTGDNRGLCIHFMCVFVFMFVYKVFTIPILISYWPAHPDDPQGIAVCLSVCSLFSILLKFSNFILMTTNNQNIGPLTPTIHRGVRVASVIEFSVCLSVCLWSVCLFSSNFLILLQHNIRPLSRNCIPCAP